MQFWCSYTPSTRLSIDISSLKSLNSKTWMNPVCYVRFQPFHRKWTQELLFLSVCTHGPDRAQEEITRPVAAKSPFSTSKAESFCTLNLEATLPKANSSPWK